MAATTERIASDAIDVGVYRDGSQAGAGVKRSVPDVGDAVGDRVVSGYAPWICNKYGLALVEQDPIHTAVDGIICIHCYRCKSRAGNESLISDAGDAVRDRDVGQGGSGAKRTRRDSGDRQAVDRAGDGHRPAWSGVSRDGDRAVSDRVNELAIIR